MLTVDPRDPTPIYAQLARGIRVAIAAGRLRTGDRLPTVRQLAVDLRVNANTVAKVYADLEKGGVLATRRGVGTFVREALPSPGIDRSGELANLIDRFLDEASSLGYTAAEAVDHLCRRLEHKG